MALATELICHYNWWNEFKNGTEQVRPVSIDRK